MESKDQFSFDGCENFSVVLKGSAYLVECDAVFNEEPVCPKCGSKKYLSWGKHTTHLVDLPIQGKPVTLAVNVKRWRCADRNCAHMFQAPVKNTAPGRLMTMRLLMSIGKNVRKHTFVSVAEDVGVAESSIRNAFKTYIELMEQNVRVHQTEWVRVLIEKIISKKRLLFIDPQSGMLNDIAESPANNVVAKHMYRAAQNTAVRYVVMPFNADYRNRVYEYMPSAKVLIELDSLSPALIKECQHGLRDAPDLKAVIGSGWMNLRRYEFDASLVEETPKLFVPLKLLVMLNQWWYGISTQAEESQIVLSKCLESGLSDQLSELLQNWRNEISNTLASEPPFDRTRLKNDTGIGQLVESMGRGYSFEALRANLLYPENIPESEIIIDGPKVMA